jgi:hypothetical protein
MTRRPLSWEGVETASGRADLSSDCPLAGANRIKKVTGGGQPFRWRPAALTTRQPSALILRWGVLDEGRDEAPDVGFDGRGTA